VTAELDENTMSRTPGGTTRLRNRNLAALPPSSDDQSRISVLSDPDVPRVRSSRMQHEANN
jgi:hypothetical protein